MQLLGEEGFDVTFQEFLLTCWQEEINSICDDYDYIVFVLNHPFAVGGFPECASTTWASHLVDKNKKIIINFGLPYLADDYYPDDPVFINAHQDMNEESIRAVVDRIVGKEPFTGRTAISLKR